MKLIRGVLFNLLAMIGLAVVVTLVLLLLRENYGIAIIDVPYMNYIVGFTSLGLVIWLGDTYCYDKECEDES